MSDATNPSVCPATPANVEGPFYRPGAPVTNDLYPPDSTGPVLYLEGLVTGPECQPLAGVLLDVWQADDTGHYDNDDPANPPPPDFYRCRGRLYTDEHGHYSLRTVVPGNYRVESANPWVRVKHLHIKLFASGHEPLTTQVAVLPDPYADTDPLFDPAVAVTPDPIPGGEDGTPAFRARYDFALARISPAGYARALRGAGS